MQSTGHVTYSSIEGVGVTYNFRTAVGRYFEIQHRR